MGLRFFYLHWLDVEEAGVAQGADDPERDELLAQPAPIAGWTVLELTLPEGELVDYLANDVAVRLCSPRLRALIDGHRSPSDEIQWLEAEVVDPSGQKHPYFVLHFPSDQDLLHPQLTLKARGGFVVKPVLALDRVQGRHVFAFRDAGVTTIISGELHDAIRAAGCTGVDFSEVPVG